jgi:hypothetical protein
MAGQRAAAREEHEPAQRLLHEAAALLVEDPRARFAALMELIDALGGWDYAGTLAAAQQAEAVGAEIDEAAALRARLWVWAARSYIDPSFGFEHLRPQIESAVETFRAAGDIDGQLDAVEVLSIVDLGAAHWKDAAMWARVGLEVAAEHGLELRRGTFARWLTNALVWGNTDARESLRVIGELLPRETRRSSRGAMLSAAGILHGILGDRPAAEAAETESRAIGIELGYRRQWFRWTFTEYALDNLSGAIEAARAEDAALAEQGETGQRSTIVALQAWLLALSGESDEALRLAEEARRLGSADDAVTQILWQAAAGVAQSQLGNLEEADRLTAAAVAAAAQTDSVSAADAWEARAWVLARLGRRPEMLDAAERARELHAAKGSVNFLRRLDRFLAEQEATAPAKS